MIYIISFLSFITFFITTTTVQAITRNSPEQWAIMFLDPDLKIQDKKTAFENASMSVPMAKDRIEYELRGYKVFVTYADDESIIKAILDGRVKSISYYGHGGGTSPTFGDRDPVSWKNVIFMRLLKHYRNQGLSQKEASKLANSESQNFGFKDVINRSCGSLYNNSVANQFVAPGQYYYGSRAERYYSCNPLALFSDKSDFTLDIYGVRSTPSGSNSKVPNTDLKESILIVLDASGSMSKQNRIEKARNAAEIVLKGITPGGNTEVGLITFSGCGNVNIVAEFTTDPQKIIAILPQIKPGGDTPLAKATAVGKQYLREKSRGAKKRFILLTDGKESCSGDPVAEMRK